jgi:hypothetical protein
LIRRNDQHGVKTIPTEVKQAETDPTGINPVARYAELIAPPIRK